MSAKDYWEAIVFETVPGNAFAQDMIEWALVTGVVPLTYDVDLDRFNIMQRYSELCSAFQAWRQQEAAMPQESAVAER
jgi:hypothetical protein